MRYLLLLLFLLMGQMAVAQDDAKFDKKLIAKAKVKQANEYIIRTSDGARPDSTLFSKTSFDKTGNQVYYVKGEFTHNPKLSQWMVANSSVYNSKGQLVCFTDIIDSVVTCREVTEYNSKGLVIKKIRYLVNGDRQTIIYTNNPRPRLIKQEYYELKGTMPTSISANDTLGKLITTHQYQYDAQGRKKRFLYSGNEVPYPVKYSNTYSYQQVKSGLNVIMASYSDKDTLRRKWETDYDKHGNIIRSFNIWPVKEAPENINIYNHKGQIVEVRSQSVTIVYAKATGHEDYNDLSGGVTTVHHDRILYIYNAEGNPLEQQRYQDGKLILKLRWHYIKHDQ